MLQSATCNEVLLKTYSAMTTATTTKLIISNYYIY